MADGIVLMDGKPVISYRAWREARTNQARADLWASLILAQFTRSDVDDVRVFARAWLDRNAKRRGDNAFALVHPVYARLLEQRFFETAHNGQGD
jgi:hypothetical protein